MCVCVCVRVCVCESECVPSFSVLAAATFSPRTRETPDLLSCCKKLSTLDRRLLSSSLKQQKPVVCRKVRFKMQRSYSPSARPFLRVAVSPKLERSRPPKFMYIHVTSTPTCMIFLSRFRLIKFFDDHGL